MSTPEASALGKGPPEQAAPTPQGTPAASLPMPPCKVPPNLLPSQQPLCLVATAVGSTKVAPAQQLPKTSIGGLRLAAPCPVVAKAPQATTLNLPVNIQLPQGTVVVGSNTGQLILVSQQALVQAQSQTQNNTNAKQSIPTNVTAFKICPAQNSGTQMLKVLAAPVKATYLNPHSVTSTIKKPAVIQTVTSTKSIATVTTVKPLNTGLSAKPSPPPPPSPSFVPKPIASKEGTAIAQTSTSVEMLENVKKCKNFLATLIKLASSGPQAPEMGQNVKNLVQSLLEAKIDPEEFTKKLYTELKSSPQPYLVPFLKKSMFALRQLMPNAQNFIQQCLQQSVAQPVALPCTTAQTAASIVVSRIPTTTVPLQSVRTDPRTPLGISSSHIASPVPCTSLVTRGSGSLHFAQPVHGSAPLVRVCSIQSANPAPSSQPATTGLSTVKAVHRTSSTAMVTSTSSLHIAKPVLAPTVSLEVHAALSSAKCVSSSTVTTSCKPKTVKPVLATGATSANVVTTSLQSTVPVPGTPITIRIAHPNSILSQSVGTSKGVKVKQMIVQQPPGGILKKVTTLQPTSAVPVVNKSGEKMPLNALIQTRQLPAGSIVKQITLPGNKILSLQASPVQRNKIRENGTTSFRDEDDINDVTSMAGVNLNEESACILAANSEAVGTLIQSCSEELLLFADALEKKILEIGKRHDIMEVNSDVLNLISHATQERLRGLLDKLTIIAQHRTMTYTDNNKYIMSSDTRAQLKFLEKLDQIEKQRKDEEQREMLLRAAKSRSNKEDPKQLCLKQKAKEMQQLELAQRQQKEANRAALAAIGPRKKRPLDSLGLEDLNRSLCLAKSYTCPRITRICLRDLIFCMEQERNMKYSLALYQTLLK